mgnify:CR=1 FL=1
MLFNKSSAGRKIRNTGKSSQLGTYSMHIALLPNENNSDRTALITITCGKDEVQARITQKATDDSGNGTGDEDEDEDEDSDSDEE